MRVAQIALVTGLLFGSVAFSAPISYYAILNGANESPANLSPGTGNAYVTIDVAVQTMLVQVTFTGLTTPNTAAHIHCCTAAPGAGTAGVATITPTFTGFPGGVTSGSYVHTFLLNDAATYNPAFITAQGSLAIAEATFLTGIAAGTEYLNIHTTQNPGGEIRGFLTPVPEPSTLLLAGAAFASLALLRRRRRA